MQHCARTNFWRQYSALPQEIRTRADKQFALLKANPQHPSLQFKEVGNREGQEIWSARITLDYRALATSGQGDTSGSGLVTTTAMNC